MKLTTITTTIILIVFSATVQAQKMPVKTVEQVEQAEGPQLKTMLDTISYIIGTDVAFTLKNNDMELISESFNRGFSDAWQGNDTLFTVEQAEAIMIKFGSELQARRQKEKAEKDAVAIAAGKKYLEENLKNEGVSETESGLQYQILVQGEGEKPLANSTVHVHYKGMLLDGTVFDSSYDRGTHNTFELSKLIPGWTEGIQMMQTGSKYKFFIPPNLAYGDREVGIIPANSTLIFEVELLGIEEVSED
jgi:FKBP-type peptidyl-prolyl cis-trans isomerase FkpA